MILLSWYRLDLPRWMQEKWNLSEKSGCWSLGTWRSSRYFIYIWQKQLCDLLDGFNLPVTHFWIISCYLILFYCNLPRLVDIFLPPPWFHSYKPRCWACWPLWWQPCWAGWQKERCPLITWCSCVQPVFLLPSWLHCCKVTTRTYTHHHHVCSKHLTSQFLPLLCQ